MGGRARRAATCEGEIREVIDCKTSCGIANLIRPPHQMESMGGREQRATTCEGSHQLNRGKISCGIVN